MTEHIQLERQGRYYYLRVGKQRFRQASQASQGLAQGLHRALAGWVPPAPAVLSVSLQVDALAAFMTKGFMEWEAQGRYVLEPGFRQLVGQPRSAHVVTVHHTRLRDDWEDDCRRAFDAWSDVSDINFLEALDASRADIVVDDERRGAFALRRMQHVGRWQGDLPPSPSTGARRAD